jgi:sugar (pentulose or hexulose) kinase
VRQGERLEPDPRNAAVYAEGYRAFRDLYRRMAAP